MSDLGDQTRSFVAFGLGTAVGRYTIAGHLGSGGMGDVYVADDAGLNRKVALKFLPAHLAGIPEARLRFVREAQAAAALNHPNVIQIYEVNDQYERPYFAMELIDGETLREVIQHRDLSVKEFLDIASQIASGLAEAHQAGIVHRDIKPANILIDKKGRVRVADFGLAAVAQSGRITKPGSTMGTMGYLSPEQARGEKVDARSDIFSLGIVLYELLTRQQPFRRDSDAGTLQAIANFQPEPIARYKAGVRDTIQYIVDKALAKDVELRYQHADDLLADLKREREALSYSSRPTTAPLVVEKRRPWTAIVAIMVAVVVIAAVIRLFLSAGDGTRPSVAKHRQVTFNGDVMVADISPDGSKLAFVRSESPGKYCLYTYSFSGGDPLAVLEAGWIADIAWSPDNNFVLAAGADANRRGVYLVPFMGGSSRFYPVRPCSPATLTWEQSGRAFYYHESCDNPKRFLKFDVLTGDTTAYPLDAPVRWVHSFRGSPDGSRLLLQAQMDTLSGVWTAKPDGTDLRHVVAQPPVFNSAAAWAPNGDAIYVLVSSSNGLMDLMRQSINARTGAARGDPVLLLSGLKAATPISVTRNGAMLTYLQSTVQTELVLWSRVDKGGKSEYRRESIGEFTHQAYRPHFSPDGASVAYASASGNQGQLYIFTPADRSTRKLTVANNDVEDCAWSPDGGKLAVLYREGSLIRLCLVDAASGNSLPSPKAWRNVPLGSEVAWAPLDQILVQEAGNHNFYRLDPAAETTERLVASDTMGWAFDPIPRTKQQVAINWNRGIKRGGFQLWLMSLDGRFLIPLSKPGMRFGPVGWSADQRYLYGRPSAGTKFCRINIDDSKIDTLFDLGTESAIWLTISPDEKQIFVIEAVTNRDVWLVENFDPEFATDD